jgi:4'-phosphopantetheinyl transferase
VNDSWMEATAWPKLGPSELQIWRAEVAGDDRDQQLARCYPILTAPEQERAARIRVGLARSEFVIGRGFLRRLLAAATGIAPREVPIEFGGWGKPQCAAAIHGPDFNVAHSRGVILIALSSGGPIGIDAEWINPNVELLDVARASFGSADVARIEKAEEGEARLRAFYRSWTRREAIAKADGRGLAYLPPLFEVAKSAGDTVVELREETGRTEYIVRELAVGENFAAAVASRTGFDRLQLLRFPPGED